jgi:hypothetical protein
MNKKEGVTMTTKRITKYDMIKVGDLISFPASMNLIKSGVIVKIKGLNGHAKEIWTENGGRFIASRHAQNKFDVYRTREEI